MICPRCHGKNSEICEQGGQACVECDGTGEVEDDREPNAWWRPQVLADTGPESELEPEGRTVIWEKPPNEKRPHR